MMTNSGLIDGSWELTITVTDLQKDRTLRVKGDLHIGGVMLRLVEALDIAIDWSDHGLWWPEKNLWLSRTRSTLDQYGVQADAKLLFTPMHKYVRVILPDLQEHETRVNFSTNVFTVAIRMCKEFGMRHPEELSLMRKIDRDALKRNQGVSATRRTEIPGMVASPNGHAPVNSNYDNGTLSSPYRLSSTPQGTISRTSARVANSPFGTMGPQSPSYPFNANGTLSPGSAHSLSFEGAMESVLANSPFVPAQTAFNVINRPRNLIEKARMNAAWFDSSRSLMEQGVEENDVLLLRFKFFNFYDLNPKYDRVRINQIYEQAKWSLISEEIDCTDDEMMMFAALQLQVQRQSGVPQPDMDGTGNQSEDEIDAALTDLQVSLEGSAVNSTNDLTRTPELHGYLRFFKPKKFAFKTYKRYYFIFRETQLSMYRVLEDKDAQAMAVYNLKGCEVNADINVSSMKFNIKLFVPTSDGMTELWLRVENEEHYARWMAAFRLASKGHTMADSSYDSEVKSIQAFVTMQHPSGSPSPAVSSGDHFAVENLVAHRVFRKMKTNRQIEQRILEAHANVQDLNLMEAKMNYIRAWQTLPEYGLTYFVVKLKGNKKEDLLGVAFNRMVKLDLHAGDVIRTWRYQNVKSWRVNWEIKQLQLSFEGEEDLAFQCLTADCKIVHEYIGGYIFLSMRSGDRNQSLNEELFHKLTGGWHQ